MLKIKECYGIKNIKTNEVLVEYETHQGNPKKAIFSMKNNAQKVIDTYMDFQYDKKLKEISKKCDYEVFVIQAELVEKVEE